jgi:hypothetical protein
LVAAFAGATLIGGCTSMFNHMAELERIHEAGYVNAAEAANRLLTPEMNAQCIADIRASYGSGLEFVHPLVFNTEAAKVVRHQVNRFTDRDNRSVEPPAAYVGTCKSESVGAGPCGCYYEVRAQLTKLVYIRRLERDDFHEHFPVMVPVIVRR